VMMWMWRVAVKVERRAIWWVIAAEEVGEELVVGELVCHVLVVFERADLCMLGFGVEVG